MQIQIEIPENKVKALRKCQELGMELGMCEKAIVDGHEAGWVPIENGFPPPDVDVLLCTNSKMQVGFYSFDMPSNPDGPLENEGWYSAETIGRRHEHGKLLDDQNVVAWMHLPGPYRICSKCKFEGRSGAQEPCWNCYFNCNFQSKEED